MKSHLEDCDHCIGFCSPTYFYKIQNLCKEMDLDVLEDQKDVIVNRSIYVIGNRKKMTKFCNRYYKFGYRTDDALPVVWIHEDKRNEFLQRLRDKHALRLE